MLAEGRVIPVNHRRRLKQFARQYRFWLSVPGSRWIRIFLVKDVSFQTKTEAIELEPHVAVPIQSREHGAIGLPLLSALLEQVSL